MGGQERRKRSKTEEEETLTYKIVKVNLFGVGLALSGKGD